MEPATYLRAALEALDPEEFECPRCGNTYNGIFRGPCPPCVASLREEQVWVEPDGWDWAEWVSENSGEFIPLMNVQPNAVALKD